MPYWFRGQVEDVRSMLGAFDEFEGTTRISDILTEEFLGPLSKPGNITPWAAFEAYCKTTEGKPGFKLSAASRLELVVETVIEISMAHGWDADRINLSLFFRKEELVIGFTLFHNLKEVRDFAVIRILLNGISVKPDLWDLDYDYP